MTTRCAVARAGRRRHRGPHRLRCAACGNPYASFAADPAPGRDLRREPQLRQPLWCLYGLYPVSAKIKPAKLVAPKVVEKRSERITVRFSKTELGKIRSAAADFGNVRDWLVSLARAQIAPGTPQFNPKTLRALYESNRELAAIGRNVNQVAHALNLELQQAGQLRRGGEWIESRSPFDFSAISDGSHRQGRRGVRLASP